MNIRIDVYAVAPVGCSVVIGNYIGVLISYSEWAQHSGRCLRESDLIDYFFVKIGSNHACIALENVTNIKYNAQLQLLTVM